MLHEFHLGSTNNVVCDKQDLRWISELILNYGQVFYFFIFAAVYRSLQLSTDLYSCLQFIVVKTVKGEAIVLVQ